MSYRTSIKTVIIEDGVTSIGNYAFYKCSSLTSVTIPNSITSIGGSAFNNCSSLASITIPNSITSIEFWAFRLCSNLTSIEIPNSVTSIGYAGLCNCSSLTSIICDAVTPPALGEEVFKNVTKSIPLYVPAESIDAYKAADQWKDFFNISPLNKVSVAGALEVISGLEANAYTESAYSVTGYVTKTTLYDSQYNNITLEIADEKDGSPVLTLFRAVPDAEADREVTVGDKITAVGQLYRYVSYNGTETPEMAKGGKYSVIEKGSSTHQYRTIYYVNTNDWNTVKAYVWIEGTETCYKSWPGEPMEKTGDKVNGHDVYSYTFPDTYTMFIAHCTNHQTEDILIDASKRYFYKDQWYASLNDIPAEVNFYITGTANLVGGQLEWDPAAIAVFADSYTFTNLAPGDYKMNFVVDGTWLGMSGLAEIPEGVSADEYNNICFTLAEAGDVVVTYTGAFTISGNFYVFSPEPCSKYGILLNGDFVEAVANEESFGYNEYMLLGMALKEGDVFSLYDNCNAAAWVAPIDEVSAEGVSIVESEGEASHYMVDITGTYDIYIKLFPGNDAIYIGKRETENPCSGEYGIMLNGQYLSAELNIDSEYLTEYKILGLELAAEDVFTLYDNCKQEHWVVDPEYAENNWIVIENGRYFVYSSGKYDLYIKLFKDGSKGLYIAQSEIVEPVNSYFIKLQASEDAGDWEWMEILPNEYGEFVLDMNYFGGGGVNFSTNRQEENDTYVTFESLGIHPFAGDIIRYVVTNGVLTAEIVGHEEPGIFTVRFVDTDGTLLAEPQSVGYGQAAVAPAVAIPQCRALSWDKDFSRVTSDLTVRAVWTVVPLASGICGENVRWEIACDGTLTISGTGAMTDYTSYIYVPWYAEYRDVITRVVVTEGVTSIGHYAFYYCTNITSVTIPNSVTFIGDYAFYYCTSLTNVTISNSVTFIGNYAFYNCTGLTYVIIPNTVTAIGGYAFYGCTGLTSVTIPASVTEIGECAFCGCVISEIHYTGTVIEWLNRYWDISQHFHSGYTLYIDGKPLSSWTVPASITEINSYAFYYCTGLTSVTFESVIPPAIGYDCFTSTSCTFYVPCGSKDAYVAALGVAADRVVEEGIPFVYSVTSSDLTQGTVTVTQAPATCDDLTLSFRADANDGWQFAQWSDGVTDNPRSLILTQDTVLTAVFAPIAQCAIETTDGITIDEDDLPYMWESKIFDEAGTQTATLKSIDGCDSVVTFTLRVRYHDIVLEENMDDDYYTAFSETYNGHTVATATLNRQFTNGKWATLCLPFDVKKGQMTSLGLRGRVYEFLYIDGFDGSTIHIYFTAAQSIEAGKGYIVSANTKLSTKTSFVFPNVTINTEADIQSGYDIAALPGYNGGTGSIYLVGTLRKGTLFDQSDGTTYLGLKDNKIYRPNSNSGTTVRAYRGFFRSDEPVSAQRVRIIVDGLDMGELEVVNGELYDADGDGRVPSVHKFIENGILYIRCNGRTYNAQGQTVE